MKKKFLLLIGIIIAQFLFSCEKKENKNKNSSIEEKKIEQPKINEDETPKDKLEDDNQKIEIKPIINSDLISVSCLKSQNQYYNCDFSNYTNKSLTNTKIFALPMEFKVFYSRGNCGSRFENGEFKEGNFKLQFATPNVSKSIFPGNIKSTLIGNSLILKDEDPWITRNVGYFDPCFFVIHKINIDFSQSAMEQIKSILEKNDNNINLESLLQEIESEPNFNKSSLEKFKNKLGINHKN